MTNQNGSSETIRETSSNNFCFDQFFRHGSPQHKPTIDVKFLEWFIGFFEAEGSFLCWPDSSTLGCRFGVEISQKDPKLMHKIRTTLGFGRVTVFTRQIDNGSEQTYARFYIHDRKNLERIVFLLNGNLLTSKKQDQFKTWIKAINVDRQERKKPLYEVNNRTFDFNLLGNGWFSGFLEGDAGFWVSPTAIRTNKNGSQSFALRMKFYITQDDQAFVTYVAKSFGLKNTNVNSLTNSRDKKLYYRFETNRLDVHLSILEYLKRFPFLGDRAIQLTRWSRLVNYRVYIYPVTEKSTQKVMRLIEQTKRT